MGQFYIIVPQATINMHRNPSCERDTIGAQPSGYTASSGGTVLTDVTNAYRGVQSCKVTPAANVSSGVFYSGVTLTSGQTYTFSTWFKGTAGLPYKIWISNSSNGSLASDTFTSTGYWQRVIVTYTETSTSSTRRFQITKNNDSNQTPFWVDAQQIEALPYETTYCDGDQPGCRWRAGSRFAEHICDSERSGQYRGAGKRVDLVSYGAYLVSQQGTGMPPMKQASTPYGNAPGSYWKGMLATDRSFTLAFSVAGDGVPAFHGKRQDLIDLMKPDLVFPQQDFIIGYTDGGDDIEIACHYDGGFELTDGKVDIETLPIKLVASQPLWYKQEEHCFPIQSPSTALSSTLWAMLRSSDGVWDTMGSGPNGQIKCAVKMSDGRWIVGGSFTSCGGVSNTAYCAAYDPSTGLWASLGVFNAEVLCVAIDPRDGYPLIGGRFTTISSSSRPYHAKYNGSGWGSIAGTGPNAAITALVIDNQANWWFWGEFTSVNGSAATRFINASTDGAFGYTSAIWNTGNTTQFNGAAVGATIDSQNGYIYVWGAFTSVTYTALSITYAANGLFKINVSGFGSLYGTISRSGIQTTSTAAPYDVVLTNDGTLIAAWKVDTVTSVTRLASWNGSYWTLLETLDSPVGSVSYDPVTERIYYNCPVVGDFDGFNYWYTFERVGTTVVRPESGQQFSDIFFDDNGNSVWAQSAAGVGAGTANATTRQIITYGGTAITSPKLIMKGMGQFYRLSNLTTGHHIYSTGDYYFNEHEVATFDFASGKVSTNRRQNTVAVVTPNSDMGSFILLPGENIIEIMAIGLNGNDIDCFITWKEQHWAIDAGTL